MNAANSPKPILLPNRLFYCHAAVHHIAVLPPDKTVYLLQNGGNNLILFDYKLTS